MTGQPLTVEIFLSVDGFAGSDNLPGYFGYFGPELQQWLTAGLDRPHVNLMGRKTYEMLAGLPAEAVDDASRKTFDTETVVFSTTLTTVAWPNARICAADPAAYVQELKDSAAAPLRTVGSLSIGRQLLTAGLVDVLRLVTFPLLAGPHGREPFLDQVAAADLTITDHQILDDRILVVDYAPTGRDIPRM